MTCVAVVGWRGVRRLPVQYVRYTSLCPWSSCDSCARRAGSSRVGLPMSEVGKDARRSLKIKTGSVTRLHKELRMYEAEVLTEAEKTERLRSACACPHDIRQQARGLGLQALPGRLPSHAGERAGRVGDDDPRLPAPAGACAGRPAGRAGASAREPARLSASSVCARRRSWARARAWRAARRLQWHGRALRTLRRSSRDFGGTHTVYAQSVSRCWQRAPGEPCSPASHSRRA